MSCECLLPWNMLVADPCTINIVMDNKSKLQEMRKQTWYPLNVEELCLYDEEGIQTVSDEPSYFWSNYVNNKSFPNLKRLKITIVINETNYKIFGAADSNTCTSTMNNMSSLIGNGLELLHFKLTDFEYHDFINSIKDLDSTIYSAQRYESINPSQIVKFWENVFDCQSRIVTNSKQQQLQHRLQQNVFVFKLEYHVSWPSVDVRNRKMYIRLQSNQFKKKLNGIIDQVGSLFIKINDRLHYCPVMFAFKIVFNTKEAEDSVYIPDQLIVNAISECVGENTKILKSDETKIVDTYTSVTTSKTVFTGVGNDVEIVFGIVFKSMNKEKFHNASDGDLCYTDPKFEYQCPCCESQCWMK